MQLITDEELDIICQFVVNYPPPFYTITTSFLQDLYNTGCRPMELLMIDRWTTTPGDSSTYTLDPLKGNNPRIISKSLLSENLIYAIDNSIAPYQNLSLRQLEYSMKKVFPVERIYAETKIIVAYPFRYNRVRKALASGMTQSQISIMFGWVSPTINATYSTQDLYIDGGVVPPETYFIINSNLDRIIDNNGDLIISQ